jgi:hypothetical protein
MMNRRWAIVVGVTLLTGPLAGTCPAATAEEAIAEAETAVRARAEAIAAVVALVDNEELFAVNPEQAAHAVELLGRLRAEEAVPILLEHVYFEWPRSMRGPALRDFPCAVALARIGGAAAPALVKLMAGDEDAAWLGTQVLVGIDGAAAAAARLRAAAAEEVHEERRKRLLRAAEFAAGLHPQELDSPGHAAPGTGFPD